MNMLGIFLDTETNGLNPLKHKILEIAYKIIDMETGEVKEQFESVISQSLETWAKSDPASLKVNGFTWEEVCQGVSPLAVREKILLHFKKCGIKRGEAVFICQNPSFDRAFFAHLINPDEQEALLWPYYWLDLASMYWKEAMQNGKENSLAFPWNTGFSKDKIAAVHKIPPEKSPHRAMNGVNHLLLCYQAVIGFPQTL